MAAPARTVFSSPYYRRRPCVYLGLLVFIGTASCVSGSFGNLVTSVTSVRPTDTDIVKDADPINKCVTYTTSGGNDPYIDVGVGQTKHVRTILVYTRKADPTPVTVYVADGSKYTFTNNATRTFHTDTNTVYVFTGSQTTYSIRVKAADQSAGLTVCMIKVYDVTLSEYCTCDDPCSRNTDYICTEAKVCTTPHATGCHGRNVALQRPTTMSSMYRTADGSYAVNGNTGTTFSGSGYTGDRTQWNCIHTNDENNPYWEVELNDSYILAYFTIYRRSTDAGKERMTGVQVSVDGRPCATLTAGKAESEQIKVTCTQPLTGSKVRVSRSGSGTYGPSLNLCEVQAWVCEPGFYGHECASVCSNNCKGGQTACDVQGKCSGGCIDRYYGSTCNRECGANCQKCEQNDGICSQCVEGRYNLPSCSLSCSGNCRSNGCADNGYCEACIDGWYLPTCSKRCSPGCQSGTCLQSTGKCSPCNDRWKGDKCNECVDQRYGQDCSEQCGKCKGGHPCDKVNGRCPGGCEPGWGPDYVCSEPCADGTYGPGCASDCRYGCKNTCNRETGQCDCKPGWIPANTCDKQCEHGRYGDNCSKTCGEGCRGNECDKTNGHCQCEDGWLGETCDSRCEKGKYGTGCQQSCSEGCTDGQCNDRTGQCSCRPGWWSPLDNQKCDTHCPGGKYGPGCNLTCGSCGHGSAACMHDTGYCIQGCADGFKGDTCHEKVSDTASAVGISLLVLGLIALIAVIVAVVFYIMWRRRKAQVPPPRANRRVQGENIYVNSPEPGVYFESYGGERAATREGDLDPGESNPTYLLGEQAGAAIDSEEDDVEDDEDTNEANAEVTEEDKYVDYQSLKLNLDRHQKFLLDRLTSGELVGEYKRLPTGLVHDHKVGSLVANKDKNRFKRIFPYDHSRVMLTPEGNDQFSDYINASFVRDQNDQNAYIAAQGPMETTVADFWRMVWKENVAQIVMLTNLMEKTKKKCHQYWPEKGRRETYGSLTVTGVDVQLRADFYTRTFHLKSTSGSVRTVTQYHMVTWPDHGVPSAFAVVNLWRYIKARADKKAGPLLVHCSAGVGRTGTYIALDILMDILLHQTHHRSISVYNVVTRLREDRVVMIQTVDQYIFLHEALLEAYTSRDTRMTLDKMDAAFPTGIRLSKVDSRTDAEYKSLSQMKNFLSKPKYVLANMEENKDKNRDPRVLPDDNHLVYLSVHVPGRNQYINAVTMPSFRQQRGMLLTQLPMVDTIVDIWRLVEGFDVNTIASITSRGEEGRGSYCQYWPRDPKHHIKAGPFIVKLIATECLGVALTSYSLKCQKGSKSRAVRVLHYSAWGEELPEETPDLLRMLEILDTSHNDVIDKPFIVQCWDGATKSGLFCSLYNVISRVTYDREVDVYLTARHAQSIRPEAVVSKAQYRYCYHVVQEYKKAFDVYANS